MGTLKMRDMKLRDMKMRHQNARVENVSHFHFHQYVLFVIKKRVGEWALSMVGVAEGHEFRFREDLYSQESTFPLVGNVVK